VYANATTLYVGNSTASIAHGNNTIVGSANIGITATNYLNVTGALTVSSNVALSNTLVVTGNTTLSNTLGVTGLASLNGAMNTTTANASVAVNVGANVNISTSTLTMGDSTLAANTRGTYTKDGITLNDTVSEASNTFSVSFNPTRYRNQKQYVNATVAVRDAIDLSRTEFFIVEREAIFSGDGGAANNLGKIYANTTVLRVSNTTVNSEISTAQIRVGANVYANATTVYVGNSTASITHGNNTIAGTANIAIVPTSYLNVTGAFTVSSNVALSNTLIVTGNTTLSNTLGVTGNASFANTLSITGNTNLSNTLTVTGNTTLSNTLAVTGAATFSNTLTVTGNTNLSDYVTFDTDYAIQVESNTNLGLTTGSPILAYRFPKATFSSAKITAQVKNNGNTQISEMVIAHDETTAYVTVFGTVASPGFANNNVNPLATFTANVNGANVDLLINQSVASSAAKLIAHLIK
jgi:hypothetical protein